MLKDRDRSVQRFEDMSPTGRLVLTQQEDGDIVLSIIPDPEDSKKYYRDNTVEFCTGCGGGGQSPHTMKALRNLMDAMLLDNQENKQYRT